MTASSEQMAEHERRREQALAMGGPAKLAKKVAAGELNARQRVALLFDEGSFRETGLFATSTTPGDEDSTPTDGKITGTGAINGRRAAVVAYDFTVKGSTGSTVSNKKNSHMKELSVRAGLPLIFLSESSGVRIPDAMGGGGMGQLSSRTRFLRRREVPWVSCNFGYSFGSAAWHAVCSDFTVIRKGTVMAVSSPRIVSRATGHDVTGEELGGWRVHAEKTGFADAVASTDEEAIDLARRFLSYLPAHNGEAPPVVPVPAGSGDRQERILEIVPGSPKQVYDVRKFIEVVVDRGSMFPIKERYGRSLVTCLARIDGKTVGIIASNPMFKGGAIDTAACDKAVSFLVLCDSYNIPLVFLADQPGFLVGMDAEHNKVLGKIINWMNALALLTVPRVTVTMRKNYGAAFVNLGGGSTADSTAAWWSAEISFMDPRSAVSAIYHLDPDTDPELYAERLAETSRGTSAYDAAQVYGVEEVIAPWDTRRFIIEALEDNRLRRSRDVGQHLLSNWPTSY